MYEAFFGLHERPFSISPDPRFFYLTSQHREALTNCQYMITNRIGPVYVHGDVGTGKTTIARRLYQQLIDDPHYQVAMIISPNLKSANALLRLIMQEFRKKFGSNIPAASEIFEYLTELTLALGQCLDLIVLRKNLDALRGIECPPRTRGELRFQ